MNRFITAAIISCSLAIPVSADEHTTSSKVLPDKPKIFAQIQPANYQPGKGLADVVAWGEDFGKLVKENGTPFRTTTWTPFYASMAALPDTAQFDTLFFGVWPSIADFGKGWTAFLENGQAVQAALDQIVVPTNQKTLMAGYDLTQQKSFVPKNTLIRIKGCELSEGKTAADIYPLAVSAAKMKTDAGVNMAASLLLIPGPGSSPSQENHVYILEAFETVEDYGVGYEKLMGATRREINAIGADAMSCDAPRLYLSNAVYWPLDFPR
ncbi:MAG: hypothetical protein VW390_07215 [Gammaproteobacteria bacterium]|jgi:hypothetical protein